MKLCAAGQLFAGRYCDNDAALAWTPEMIKPIIEAKFDDDSDDDEEEEEDKISSPSKGNNDGKARKVRPTSKPNPAIPTTDFLHKLGNALHAETVEMSLDYLRIHRFCWTLLRSVHDNCEPRLLETYGGGYLERENQLPFA